VTNVRFITSQLYFEICFDAFALNTNMQKGCVNRQIARLPLVYNNKVPFPLYEEDEEDVADFAAVVLIDVDPR
jgi:hypothetical protein